MTIDTNGRSQAEGSFSKEDFIAGQNAEERETSVEIQNVISPSLWSKLLRRRRV